MGAGQSQTRVYCPANTHWDTRDVNGTLYVICTSLTQEQISMNADNSFVLGLGLGLGIPAFIMMIYIVKYFYIYYKYERPLDTRSRARITNTISPEVVAIQMPQETVERELSEDALRDFRFGNLSPILIEELMILRVNKGHDLTEYVRYADICIQPQIADWIYKLSPGEIPREVREKAYRKIHPVITP